MPYEDAPGTPCAFNPCSVPGFCGRGRTCEMDNNCIHRCVCEENSDHVKCKETDDKTTTPQPFKCTFNPCSSPAFSCSGGRKCALGTFCMPECQCTDHSTHPSCAEENEGVTTTTLEPTTSHRETECSDDNPCINGKCMRSKTCVCDSGWEGATCNVSLCTKACDVTNLRGQSQQTCDSCNLDTTYNLWMNAPVSQALYAFTDIATKMEMKNSVSATQTH
ncbi:hypothetical protein DPMN_083652 [Dreissena polymorpha]|uniref:EGF-like domain-containing protein n=1 Tax=Dreissena polymorpha TaxID=45954 RepID=A0A9D4BIH2_DREPO|nr:hypothetical protein DPMN_083652 [Dreissena polymorpha]